MIKTTNSMGLAQMSCSANSSFECPIQMTCFNWVISNILFARQSPVAWYKQQIRWKCKQTWRPTSFLSTPTQTEKSQVSTDWMTLIGLRFPNDVRDHDTDIFFEFSFHNRSLCIQWIPTMKCFRLSQLFTSCSPPLSESSWSGVVASDLGYR